MSTKFVVGYDGSPASERALAFATERAKAGGASLVVAYVLEWSPYSFLTPEELEQRHKRRKEELARADEAIIQPVMAKIEGVSATSEIRYGGIAETISKIAEDTGASQVFIGRQGSTGFADRVFGSTAGKLAQIAPVPCTIVP